MKLGLYIAFFLSLLTSFAQAEITVVIEKGVDKPTQIAVVPFNWDGGGSQPENFASIVQSNLTRSGLFQTMPEGNMLSFPSPGNAFNFRDWRITDMEYILIGTGRNTAEGLEVEFELYNVITQSLVEARKVQGGASNGRDIAHRVSDLVYEIITGIEGVFGTQILYVTDATIADGTKLYRLMLSDQDGAREQLITESTEPLMSPAWSPDGNQIAYVSFETGRSAIFSQELSTGSRRQLTSFRGINGAPAWSPDGSQLAMSLSKDGNSELYILDIATEEFRRITNHFSIDTEPNWTPDGKSLVFTSDRGGRPQIYQVELDTLKTVRVTFEGDYNARPRLSKDGRYLVHIHRNNGRYHVAVLDLNLDRLLIVTETSLDESPTIAPNGAMVMYATKLAGRGMSTQLAMHC